MKSTCFGAFPKISILGKTDGKPLSPKPFPKTAPWRFSVSLVFCAVLLLGSCVSPSFSTGASRQIPADFFGVIPGGQGPLSREHEFLDELGVVWMRNTFYWSDIERRQGEWDFSRYDEYVEEGKKAGRKILAILAYDTPWIYADQKRRRNITPERLPHYLRYVEEVVRRYRGKIDAYEIWNEPNWVFWKGTNQDFFALSRAALGKIRELDPQVKIAAGSFSWVPKKFIRDMFNSGAMEGADVVSFHPYGVNPQSSLKQYDRFVKVLSEKGYTGEIWVTEVGYPTDGCYPTRVPEAVFPEYVVKTLAGLAIRGAHTVFWYELTGAYFRGQEPNRVNSEYFFGLAYPDYSPRTGAAAYALCGRYIAGAEYRPELPVRENLPPAVETLYFRGEGGRNTLILWNNGKSPLPLRVLLPGSAQTLHDIVSGEGRALPEETELSLDKTPQFFTWLSGPEESLRPLAARR
ncbi:MAG: hypothetical protein LBG25_02615 [Spirochaetaceae bacterium]|jgi:hypothetical protein|nr:hypothetical protein [Spirochaetaceae bacterium]